MVLQVRRWLLWFAVAGFVVAAGAQENELDNDEDQQDPAFVPQGELVEQTVSSPNEGAQGSSLPTEIMEEVIVTGRPEEFPNQLTFEDRHQVHKRGEYYYRTRQYKKAFPYLLASAKQGFKMAQARLGFIYQQGLGDVPRDGWRAMGWLGVAAVEDTDPEIRNYYKRLLKKIPEELLPAVEAVVAEYVKRYGPDATGMDCIITRSAGSHIARMVCNFEDEFNFQDVNSILEGNSTGAIPAGPVGGATAPTPPSGN